MVDQSLGATGSQNRRLLSLHTEMLVSWRLQCGGSAYRQTSFPGDPGPFSSIGV